MHATTLLREQVQQAHAFLEATMEGVTPEQTHWTPPGVAKPLAATYVHAIASEDLAINQILQGVRPSMPGSGLRRRASARSNP